MIKLKITETRIKAWDLCPLTVGNVNSLSAELSFSASWNGLSKYAVFANGDTVVSVPLSTDICPIPWEVLAHTGELFVSLRGMTGGGNVVLCTENAFLGRVHSSLAAAIAEEYRENTPDVLDTLEERVTELEGRSAGSGKFVVKLNGTTIISDNTFDIMAEAHEAGETVELWTASSSDVDIDISHDVYNVFKYHNTEESKSIIFSNVSSEEAMQILVCKEGGEAVWDTETTGIPTQFSQLTSDTDHRTVTDDEKAEWDAKQDALIAGEGITIAADGKTISASGSTFIVEAYTGGYIFNQSNQMSYNITFNKTVAEVVAHLPNVAMRVMNRNVGDEAMWLFPSIPVRNISDVGVSILFTGKSATNRFVSIFMSANAGESYWRTSNLAYESEMNGKQDAITANGLLKGDGSGGVTAAVAGTDYLTLATLPIYDGGVE